MGGDRTLAINTFVVYPVLTSDSIVCGYRVFPYLV